MNVLICDDLESETDKLAVVLGDFGIEPTVFHKGCDVPGYGNQHDLIKEQRCLRFRFAGMKYAASEPYSGTQNESNCFLRFLPISRTMKAAVEALPLSFAAKADM